VAGTDLKSIGAYRTQTEPMQVVSGPVGKQKIHFEAPPSKTMRQEMSRFIIWFNNTAPDGRQRDARADARRHRPPVLRLHPSVQKRQ
jgi:Fic family protein